MGNDRGTALRRFEAITQWPMLVLALLYAGFLLLPLFRALGGTEQHEISLVEYAIWAFFAVEYSIRFVLAERKWEFFKANLLDLVIVVVPFLRPLRVFRAFVALRFIAALLRGTKSIRIVFGRRNIGYVFALAVMWVVGSAGVATLFERNASGSNIRSFSDGLWWAFVTVFTVGYGDKYPVTPEGKGIAIALMIVGLALTGIVAGSLASFFVEQQSTGEPRVGDLASIDARLAAIERHLGVSSATATDRADGGPRD